MSETTNTELQKSFNHPTGDGVAVSGGIGGATARGPLGALSPAESLGNIATANFGVTTGANAVNPSGTPGGILAPEQARRFIDYVWDATVLAKDGRRVTMRANTMELEKVNVGEWHRIWNSFSR